jgi:hypothetical protein
VKFREGAFMKYPSSMRTAVMAATLGAGCVLAQTTTPAPAPTPVPTEPTAPVVSDVGPRPAEDRSSTGAIVLENSLVRAQRENAFQRSSSQTGVATVGRGAVRAITKAQTENDLAKARQDEALDLYQRGAGSLIEK